MAAPDPQALSRGPNGKQQKVCSAKVPLSPVKSNFSPARTSSIIYLSSKSTVTKRYVVNSE
eukprot:12908094-Prorocentrum_lima.AAC.1